MKSLYLTAACGAALLMATPAVAAPIGGGQTAVLPTIDLAPLGLALEIDGGEAADGGIVLFEITGGELDFDTLAGTIEHEGSGLNLVADLGNDDEDDDIVINLSNFLINTESSLLLGDVDVGDDDTDVLEGVELFALDLIGLTADQITDLENPIIPLSLTDVAADLLEDEFDVDDTTQLNGAIFGNAATAPTQAAVDISEPGLAALFGSGLIGLGLMRRRRR